MSAPFVYVGTWTHKEDKIDEAEKWLAEYCEIVEANEPRLIAFQAFLSEDRRTASVVQVHPDADSMERHLATLAEHYETASRYIDEFVTDQHFGTPTQSLREKLAPWEDQIETTWKPVYVGGFTRTTVR